MGRGISLDSSLKNFIISILSSIISGIIMLFIQQLTSFTLFTNPVIYLVAALILIIVYLTLMVSNFRSLGIKKILPSTIKGEGGTKSQMSLARQNLCFMGIASSKWISESKEFELMLRRICSMNSGSIRFLLLDPNSESTKNLSLAKGIRENIVKKDIEKSLDSLKNILTALKNESNYEAIKKKFEVRLYVQMPVYRLILIDNSRAYLSFYRRGSDGSKIKQLVIYPSKHISSDKQNIFNSLSEYFESLWDANETITYNLLS